MTYEHEVHAYTRCEKCGGSIPPNAGYVLSTLAGKVHAHHKACAPTVTLTKSSATPEQIAEARDWIADAFPANPCFHAEGDAHPVYDDDDAYVQRFVNANYPGGWPAFVADCCTYVQL